MKDSAIRHKKDLENFSERRLEEKTVLETSQMGGELKRILMK
jgi:hypothetical protein